MQWVAIETLGGRGPYKTQKASLDALEKMTLLTHYNLQKRSTKREENFKLITFCSVTFAFWVLSFTAVVKGPKRLFKGLFKWFVKEKVS